MIEILHIEDNTGDRLIIKEYIGAIENLAAEITPAANLKEGKEHLRTRDFDLILLDLGLPDAQGTEGVEELIAINNELLIIVLSGNERKEIAYQAIEKGAEDFLNKHDLNPALLEKTLHFALKRAELRQKNLRLNRTLQTTERRFSLVASHPSVYILRTDLEGKYTYYNQTFAKTFLRSNTSVIGHNSLEHIIEGDHPVTYETVQKCLENPGEIFRVNLRKPGVIPGTILQTTWEFVALTDERGVPYEMQCTGIDVTEKVRTETELQRLKEQQKMVLEHGGDIYLLLDDQGKIVYASGNFKSILAQDASELIGFTFEKLLDISSAHAWQELLKHQASGEKRFDLSLISKKGQLKRLEFNAKSIHKPSYQLVLVGRDITEQAKAEQQWKENERQLNDLFELNPHMVVVADLEDGKLLRANKAFFLETKLKKESSLGKKKVDLNIWENPEDRDRFTNLLASQGTISKFITHWQGNHKQSFPVRISARLAEVDGVLCELIVAENISKEVKAQEQSEKAVADMEFYRYALDQHSIIVRTNPVGVITYVNEHFCLHTGYDKEEILGENINILNSGYHSKAFFSDLWKTVQNGEVWRGEVCNKHKNGELKWVQTTIVPRVDSSTEKIFEYVALRTDVTELKESEAYLKESQTQLWNTINSSEHEIWSINKEFKLLTYNQRFKENFKKHFKIELHRGQDMMALEHFPVELSKTWRTRYQTAFKGKTELYYDKYQDPITKEPREVEVTVYPTFSLEGEIMGANVFSQDISELRKYQNELLASNIQMQEAEELGNLGSCYFEIKTENFVYTNGFARILGIKSKKAQSYQQVLKKFGFEERETLKQEASKLYAGKVGDSASFTVRLNDKKVLKVNAQVQATAGNGKKLQATIADVSREVKLLELENERKVEMSQLAHFSSHLVSLDKAEEVINESARFVRDTFGVADVFGTQINQDVLGNQYYEVLQFYPRSSGKSLSLLSQKLSHVQGKRFARQIPKGHDQKLAKYRLFELKDPTAFANSRFTVEFFEAISQKYPKEKAYAIGLANEEQLFGALIIITDRNILRHNRRKYLENGLTLSGSVLNNLRVQENLSAQEFILNQALVAGRSGVFQLLIPEKKIWANAQYQKLLGYPGEEGRTYTQEEDLALIHPHFVDKVWQAYQELLAEPERGYVVEIKVRKADSSYLWVQDRAVISKWDDQGKPIELTGTRTDIHQRKQREDRLLLLESAIVNSKDAIVITDNNLEAPGPTILYANPAFVDLSGYSIEEIIGNNPRMMQGSKTNREAFKDLRETLKKGEAFNTEVINYNKQGLSYWVDLGIVPVTKKDGSISHFISVERDVTERKQKDLEIKELLDRFQLASEINNIGVWDLYPQSNELRWDKNMYRLYETKPEDFKGDLEAWQATIHPDDMERVVKLVNETIASDSLDIKFEFKSLLPNGKIKHIASLGKITRDEQGHAIRAVGLNWDISEIIEYQEQLKIGLSRLELATNAANMGIWDLNLSTGLLTWDDTMYDLYQMDRKDFTNDFEAWTQSLHPEDKEAGEKAVVEAIANPNKGFEHQFRVITPDGIRHIAGAATIILDAEGKPTQMIGINWDITDTIRHQEEINERLAERNQILESVSDGFILVDRDWKVLYWNGAASKILGRKKEAAINQSLWKEYQATKNGPFYKAYQQAMAKGEIVRLTDFHKRSGKWLEASAYPNAKGLAIYFRDVTEVLEQQRALKQLQQNQEAVINATDGMVWSVDSNFKLLSANENYLNRLASVYGLKINPKDSNHERLAQLPETVSDKLIGLYQKVLTGEEVHMVYEEGEEAHPEKGSKHFSIDFYPILDDDGKVSGVACYSNDITEKVLHERAIEEQNKKLREIAWMQSHVLRAPLARILGLVELIKEEKEAPKEELFYYLDNLVGSAGELDQVVHEITARTKQFKSEEK